jgi:hypothetical protein
MSHSKGKSKARLIGIGRACRVFVLANAKHQTAMCP